VIVALADFAVRSHPERWIARRVAMLGIGAAVAASFIQAAAVILSGLAGFGVVPGTG
jgi:hypothetical protein